MFQNYIREQDNKTSYNLVLQTLQFLDCICGSTSGSLGLLGLYINEDNVELIKQCLESLTEYCQGPCPENQVLYEIYFLNIETLIQLYFVCIAIVRVNVLVTVFVSVLFAGFLLIMQRLT